MAEFYYLAWTGLGGFLTLTGVIIGLRARELSNCLSLIIAAAIASSCFITGIKLLAWAAPIYFTT